MEIERGGQTLVGYPALVDEGEAVSLQVFDSPEKAKELHRAGVRRLLAIAFRDRVRDLERAWAKDALLGPLKDDLVAAALDRAFLGEAPPMLAAEFARAVEEGRSRFVLIAQEVARAASAILAEHAALQKKLAVAAKNHPRESDDIKRQFERLLAPGLAGPHALAAAAALPALPQGGGAAPGQAARRSGARRAPGGGPGAAAGGLAARGGGARALRRPVAELEQFGWLLEELRVSLFAQELKTPVPVSAKRLAKLWQTVRA